MCTCMFWPLIAPLILPLTAGVCLCDVLWDENLCWFREALPTSAYDHRVCAGVCTESQVLSTCTVIHIWLFLCRQSSAHTDPFINSTVHGTSSLHFLCVVVQWISFSTSLPHSRRVTSLASAPLIIVYCLLLRRCLCACVRHWKFASSSTIGLRAGTACFSWILYLSALSSTPLLACARALLGRAVPLRWWWCLMKAECL